MLLFTFGRLDRLKGIALDQKSVYIFGHGKPKPSNVYIFSDSETFLAAMTFSYPLEIRPPRENGDSEGTEGHVYVQPQKNIATG